MIPMWQVSVSLLGAALVVLSCVTWYLHRKLKLIDEVCRSLAHLEDADLYE